MTQVEKILNYLWSVAPEGATNRQIAEATGIHYGQVVGDAKYYTRVGGTGLPPAKFSVIAEYVWLLEKTEAREKFLVFGNDREVPRLWLKRYGHLVTDIAFYFLSASGDLEQLSEITEP